MRATPATLLLAAIGSLATLSACSSHERSTASASGDAGGTVIVNVPADATDLFPPYVGDLTGRTVQDQVFDRLAEIGPEMRTIGDKGFAPRLAQKWTWAPDSLSIAFTIDPRARWHDGKPVTAADVRYSFLAFTDPKVGSPVAPLLANLDSVSVKDSATAVVWFKKHTPEQFYDVAYQLIIMPEHVYGRIPMDKLRTDTLTRTPIGSGRFRFVRWQPGVRIELISDTANYRGRAKLDRVVFVPAVGPTGAAQILSGQSDFMEGFPMDQASKLDSSTVARGLIFPNFGYSFMALNAFDPKSRQAPHPIFGDLRVRRAMAMAVDRVAMLKNVFGNAGQLGHGPFAMTAPYADSTIKLPPYDTAAAKAMLDSSGWRVGANGVREKNGKPLRFTISVPTTSLPRMRYGVLLQEQLRKIGAQVDLEQGDNNAMTEHIRKRDFDAILASFVADPSPSGTKQNWSTSGIGEQGQNFLGYSNHKVDALLDSASAAFDADKSKHYASQAFQTIADDVPAIFLYDITLVDGINRRLNIAAMRPDGWWDNLADWSIPADKRIDRDRIGLQAKP